MTVYYVDADELDALASAASSARNDIYWLLAPLEFGQGAVPWQRDTQAEWSHIKTRIKTEIQQLDDEARSLRDRANRARWEAAKRAMFSSAPAWLAVFPAASLQAIFGVLGSGVLGWEGAQASDVVVEPAPHAVPRFVIQDHVVAKSVDQTIAETLRDFTAVHAKGTPGGQCVVFVQAYSKQLGISGAPIGSFDGDQGPKWQWTHRCPAFQPPWHRLEGEVPPKPGDIMFVNFDGPGHVMIVQSVSPDGRSFTVVDSNHGTGKTGLVDYRSYTYGEGEIKNRIFGVMRFGGS